MTVDVETSNGGESSAEVPDLFTNMPQSATIDSSTLGCQTLALGIAANPNYGKSRPTRESVLQRLSEALMRRSLTKVCTIVTFVYIYRSNWMQIVVHTSLLLPSLYNHLTVDWKIDLSQRGLQSSDARLVKMALLQNSNLSILKLGYNNLRDEGIITLAVGISAHRTLGSLDLGFNQVGDEGTRALANALFGSALHTLYLAGNHMGEDGAIALADVIRRGCAVTKLHLTGNRLGPDGVIGITEAILEDEVRRKDASNGVKNARGIQELFLGGTSMGPMGCHAVGTMLSRSTTIRVISLANCGITDEEVAVLAICIKNNREALPLEALQLSFNAITCKGLDLLTNALWGSQFIRELLLDNNDIGDRGAQQIANILPYVKTLEVLDVGFNGIKTQGMKALMKVVAETQHLLSLSVSGNPIDTGTAKAVAYALAYNQSLKSLFLDHCDIQHEGQRHIVAGFVSNSGTLLRKLTGFRIGRE